MRLHPRLLGSVLLLSLTGLPVPLLGQTEPPRVTASLGVTAMSAGPGRSLGESLAQIGFDHDLASEPTPVSRNLLHLLVQAHVRFSDRQAIGLLVGGAHAYTVGYRPRPPDAGGGLSELSAAYVIDSTGVVYSWWFGRYLRVGGGPALHSSRLQLSSDGGGMSLGRTRVLGWITDISLNAPTRKTGTAFEINLQRRRAGGRDIEPQVMRLDPRLGNVMFPRTHVDFTHWALSASAGLRF